VTKFPGTIEELQSLIANLGVGGEWMELSNQNYRFTTGDGAVLNWWQKTKTVQIQGPKAIKTTFEEQVLKAIAEWKPVPRSTSLQSPVRSSFAGQENKRVFVVHGHDLASREQLELILHRLKLEPFVLANTGGGGLTLIEALEQEIGPQPGQCRFGIVLLTPDDMGYAAAEGVTKAAPRARQNVVLEMGMVIAALGRPNVAILQKGIIEKPSDVQGIIYIPFNTHVKEAVPKLVERLNQAGFRLDTTEIARATA
jgi:predicted nucleotide-binding protein